jgi:gamma-glutamylaminecyclotransferase
MDRPSFKQSSGRRSSIDAASAASVTIPLDDQFAWAIVRVFVYGSLLWGEDNHHHLSRSPRLGTCRTEPRYTLVDLGSYPALLDGGTTSVHGEIYEVDASTLLSLDAFEGHPLLYRRTLIRMTNGTSAVGYVLQQTNLASGCPALASGDWRGRRSK